MVTMIVGTNLMRLTAINMSEKVIQAKSCVTCLCFSRFFEREYDWVIMAGSQTECIFRRRQSIEIDIGNQSITLTNFCQSVSEIDNNRSLRKSCRLLSIAKNR